MHFASLEIALLCLGIGVHLATLPLTARMNKSRVAKGSSQNFDPTVFWNSVFASHPDAFSNLIEVWWLNSSLFPCSAFAQVCLNPCKFSQSMPENVEHRCCPRR